MSYTGVVPSRRSQPSFTEVLGLVIGYALLLLVVYVAIYTTLWPYTVFAISVCALVGYFGGNAAIRRVTRRRAHEAERRRSLGMP